MKKIMFLSIVCAIALAMTFASCGEKKATQNTEEAIPGTDYTLVTTPKGEKGIKKGEDIIVTPLDIYKNIAVSNGMLLATTESGYSLLDPETGYGVLDADTIIWRETCFEGKKGENYLVYIPANKTRFAAQAYAAKGAYAIALFNGKFTIWKDGEEIVEPNGEYSRIAILPDGSLLCLEGKTWGIGKITKDKLIQPGKAATPKELKAFKANKGWSDSAECMILE